MVIAGFLNHQRYRDVYVSELGAPKSPILSPAKRLIICCWGFAGPDIMRHTRECIYLYECRICITAPSNGWCLNPIYIDIPHTLGLLTMVDFQSRRMYAITGISFSGCGLKRCLDLFFCALYLDEIRHQL